jgi:hypothetical protein
MANLKKKSTYITIGLITASALVFFLIGTVTSNLGGKSPQSLTALTEDVANRCNESGSTRAASNEFTIYIATDQAENYINNAERSDRCIRIKSTE